MADYAPMSETAQYYRIRLTNIPRTQEDELSVIAFGHGALGVSEALSFTQPDLTYDPSLIPKRFLDVDVFFETNPEQKFFDSVKGLNPLIQIETITEDQKDWLEEWKKGFVPFKLVGPVWVVPSWLEKPPEAQLQVRIDPGMAFGTGTHATTKMASYFVHKLAQENADKVKDWTVLDVGTGTAILAVLAERVGYGMITGIEIDPEARRKARENLILNQTKDVIVTDQLLEEVREQFDVVIANIIDGVLIKLRKDLIRVVKPQGHLFLTGILQERDNLFFEKFIEASPELKVIKRIQKDEWVGYWVQRIN